MDPSLKAEIRADAIRHNLRAIRSQLKPGTAICAAVKADAYGHGIECVLPVLKETGIEALAVAHLEEGLELRSLGWTRSILCLGAPLSAQSNGDQSRRIRDAVAADISCTVISAAEARLLAGEASRLNRRARVEIKIDSGMGRMGVLAVDAFRKIGEIAATPGLLIEGVYTHFATSDEPDLTFARKQLELTELLRGEIAVAGIRVNHFHAANSAAVFRMPTSHLDMVRPGLAVYGCWGGPPGERPALQPALRVTGRLAAVRRLPAGHAIGYGCTYRTTRESLIGVVPIGYADGYRRALSGDAFMTVAATRGRPAHRVPVVGRVSMDQVSIDLTDVPEVRVGDNVIVVDDDPAASNSVESIARKLNTIPYEVICSLGERISRIRT